MPNPLDLAWAAGLFEGEGCFSARLGRERADGTRQQYPQCVLGSVDREIIERFHRIVGFGAVRLEPRTHLKQVDGSPRQDLWRWETNNTTDFRAAADLLGPHLGTRRRARLAELVEASKSVVAKPRPTKGGK